MRPHRSSYLNQYKGDLFEKLAFPFVRDRSLLDVGCGDGSDADIFMRDYGLRTTGIDVYRHENIGRIRGLRFRKAGILRIPFPAGSFDYVFAHDVLHHVDEPRQDRSLLLQGLREMKRVCRKGGTLLLVEGNRYNPLFYPHMVRMLKHEHFTQSFFKELVLQEMPQAEFRHFEAHYYPPRFLAFWKIYESLMERLSPRAFLAYNVAVVVQEGGRPRPSRRSIPEGTRNAPIPPSAQGRRLPPLPVGRAHR